MSVSITINGVSYSQPDQGTPAPWGDIQANIIVALANSTLQKSGGSFTLTAEVDFGATYGLKSAYFKSRTANISTTGVVRYANNEGEGWRNAANNADLLLKVNASDAIEFNGTALSTFANPMTTNGDLITRAAGVPARLAIGIDGQVLLVSSGAPAWGNVAGTGDVVGPASSTDNALARFDSTTGKIIQNSAVTVDDAGIMAGSGKTVFANSVATEMTRSTGTSVGANGVAISNSSGSFTSTSTSYVDVTNLSVTITTSGRPVFLTLMGDSSSSGFIGSANTTNGATIILSVDIAFLRGASIINEGSLLKNTTLVAPSDLDACSSYVPSSSFSCIDAVAAGTYTYKVQVKTVANNTASVASTKLVAYEL